MRLGRARSSQLDDSRIKVVRKSERSPSARETHNAVRLRRESASNCTGRTRSGCSSSFCVVIASAFSVRTCTAGGGSEILESNRGGNGIFPVPIHDKENQIAAGGLARGQHIQVGNARESPARGELPRGRYRCELRFAWPPAYRPHSWNKARTPSIAASDKHARAACGSPRTPSGRSYRKWERNRHGSRIMFIQPAVMMAPPRLLKLGKFAAGGERNSHSVKASFTRPRVAGLASICAFAASSSLPTPTGRANPAARRAS